VLERFRNHCGLMTIASLGETTKSCCGFGLHQLRNRSSRSRLEIEKPRLSGFSVNGQSLASQRVPGRVTSAGGRFRLRLVLVEPGLCSPDLKRGARGLLRASASLASVVIAVLMPFYIIIIFMYLDQIKGLLIPVYGSLTAARILEFIEIHSLSVGSADNNECRGRLPGCAGWEFCKPGTVGRFGDIPGVPTERSLRPRRHPHSQKQRSPPAKLPP
jgi:hypothetical protein